MALTIMRLGLRLPILVVILLAPGLAVPVARAQTEGRDEGPPVSDADSEAPLQVGVHPRANDAAIETRLSRILNATGWYQNATVETRDGVVFLHGKAESEQRKRWAGELARNTEDVVAVVNQMELVQRPLWDLGPAFDELRGLAARIIHALPWMGFALLVLFATWLLSRAVRLAAISIAERRVRVALLRRLLARAAGFVVIVVGVYVVLYVSGLTRLAVTVLGGTGLLGLILGIAFRDITENFLASVFLSIQQPFRVNDLVEIADMTGFVQSTTFRTTILLTLDGNHVQIPNATVYKAVIRNFTSNPNRREEFDVGIGYDVPISKAQEVARAVLQQHPAVLDQPEPWVLVHALGSSAVGLRVYFWLDGTRHSWLKVRSSVIRLIKRAFQEAAIEMPDEAREVVFPQGLPVRMLQGEQAEPSRAPERAAAESESSEVATHAEAHLETEAGEIKHQAQTSRSPERGENLLSD